MNKINNSKHLLLIAMLYATASVSADIVAYKFSYFFGYVQSGATILFPITYVLGDISAEVYGWNNAMKIVWFGLISEVFFTCLIYFVVYLPSSHVGNYQNEYSDITHGLGLFVFAGVVSNAFSGLLNVYFISKWKVITKGRFFWLRSIISTCISELILIGMTMAIAFIPFIEIKSTFKLFLHAYTLEIIYALIFVIPAQLLVTYLKKSEGVDIYDTGISYNPFKFAN